MVASVVFSARSGTGAWSPSEQSRKRSPGRVDGRDLDRHVRDWPIARVSSWRRGWFSTSSGFSTPIAIHSAISE
jgi:hypothetical protein